MFSFIKDKITKIYDQFTSKAKSIFSREKLDAEFLTELEKLLITADTGIKTTKKIISTLSDAIKQNKITDSNQAKEALENLLITHLASCPAKEPTPKILLLVGINGSGKTTFAAKYANMLKQKGKKVLLVAADTFRAAATTQLNEWAQKAGIPIFIGKENQDPASVIFDGCKKFVDQNFDHIIIDTAGRLQTKVNLMNELEKIKKVLGKALPGQTATTWLTVDAMLGQNSLQQAEVFHQSTQLDGIILTKLDGTGKGGVVFSITESLQLPIVYITFGEKLEDIKQFNTQEYVKGLFE